MKIFFEVVTAVIPPMAIVDSKKRAVFNTIIGKILISDLRTWLTFVGHLEEQRPCLRYSLLPLLGEC